MEEKRKCKILYFSLSDEMRREEKLEWFRDTKFEDIDFERIKPDEKGNWINQTDNDFDSLIPVCAKEKSQNTIFKFSSLGVSTNRDEWVYDFSKDTLAKKVPFFIEKYNELLEKGDFSWDISIKWSRDLKKKFHQKKTISFDEKLIISTNYRPFTKQFWYAEKLLNDILTQNHYDIFGKELDKQNLVIVVPGLSSPKDFHTLIFDKIVDLNALPAGARLIPLYRYEKGEKVENITDWALALFEKRYESLENRELSIEDRDLSVDNTPPSILDPRISKLDPQISKTDIFHYVYAVLHNPEYRTKYAQNLKRDFPKIPLYADFWKYADAGKKLMDLHLNYEKIEERVLRVEDRANLNTLVPRPNPLAPRPKLKANKELGEIYIDEQTTLTGVPPLAWEYKLGNRSALEWVLDQYKEKKPSDPTILEKFNTYRFADYKESVIELLQKVCYISVQTMQIVNNFVTQTLVCDKNQKKQCQN